MRLNLATLITPVCSRSNHEQDSICAQVEFWCNSKILNAPGIPDDGSQVLHSISFQSDGIGQTPMESWQIV
jgi:hypothetical protein